RPPPHRPRPRRPPPAASPMSLGRLWAGWRMPYVSGAAGGAPPEPGHCVLCGILASGEPDDTSYVVWRGERCAAVLNAFPYSSGHVMVMPLRHVGDLRALTDAEGLELWRAMTDAVGALETAYRPEGVNVGFNLGLAAGAGIPDHLHAHVVPRWNGDTNFMTTMAETRVLPEALPVTWERLRSAWPARGGSRAATASGPRPRSSGTSRGRADRR
ncbi:MAG: HIT family protein, partial [Acidimicrobiales bacterium]